MMVVSEFDVREVAGVTARMGASIGKVLLEEMEYWVRIELPKYDQFADLTVDQARKLSRQLVRMAKRVEDRTA